MGIVLSTLDTNRSATLPCALPSIVLTPSHQTTSQVIFDATSNYVDEKPNNLEPALNQFGPRHPVNTLAVSLLTGRMPHNSLLGTSR